MNDEKNHQTRMLWAVTGSLAAAAYSQESIYGNVIAKTLDKLKEKGLSPEQRAPNTDEIVDNLALAILNGKGGIVSGRK